MLGIVLIAAAGIFAIMVGIVAVVFDAGEDRGYVLAVTPWKCRCILLHPYRAI